MLVPPILKLLDDESTLIKAKGSELLALLLDNTSPSLLARTGLGDVMQEALMPCLLHLPSLTPQAESLALLNATYPALIALSHVQYPSAGEPSPSPARIRFLDQILRKGVLAGYAHCSENVEMSEFFVRQLSHLVADMGVYSVKHLKVSHQAIWPTYTRPFALSAESRHQYIVPLLSDILANPFGTAYPPLLLAASQTLDTVIREAWQRMGPWRAEILRGLCLCWCRALDEHRSEHGDTGGELDAVQDAVRESLLALRTALSKGDADVGADVQVELDLDAELSLLVKADQRLELLFA